MAVGIMRRPEPNSDLRKTNSRMARKRQRRDDYKARTRQRRDKRRELALLMAGIGTGWVQRWVR